MAGVSASVTELDRALSYALGCLGKLGMVLKPEQEASIRHIYKGKDVFVWLPTGFGKSICYECLPFVFDFRATTAAAHASHSRHPTQGTSEIESVAAKCSLVIVISPLISLMVDQVMSLRHRDVRAAVISSGSGVDKDLLATEEDLAACSLLFCVPEVLVGSKWRETLVTPVIGNRIVATLVSA